MVNNHPIWKFQLSHLFSLGIETKVIEFGSIEILVLSIRTMLGKVGSRDGRQRVICDYCESIAEAVISVFNRHKSDIKTISDEKLNDEMFVTWNGPEIGECDEILKITV